MAHAELLSAVPAPGQNLDKQPGELRLTFSEEVGPGSTITLFGEGFQEIDGLAATVDVDERAQLVTAVPALEPGTYSVNWLVISTDGHPASGSYTFGVLPEAATNFPVAMGLVVAATVILLGAGIWRSRKGKTQLHTN